MSWWLISVAVWASVAMPLAVFIGRAVRIADLRNEAPSGSPLHDFMPEAWNSPAEPR